MCVCVLSVTPEWYIASKKDLGRQGVICFLAREAAIAVSLFYSSGNIAFSTLKLRHSEVSFTLFLD